MFSTQAKKMPKTARFTALPIHGLRTQSVINSRTIEFPLSPAPKQIGSFFVPLVLLVSIGLLTLLGWKIFMDFQMVRHLNSLQIRNTTPTINLPENPVEKPNHTPIPLAVPIIDPNPVTGEEGKEIGNLVFL